MGETLACDLCGYDPASDYADEARAMKFCDTCGVDYCDECKLGAHDAMHEIAAAAAERTAGW